MADMVNKLFRCSLLLLMFSLSAILHADCQMDQELNRGYLAMYNLDFETAHATFKQWQQAHPDDPMGPVSDAGAYLFSEFNRLKILQLELFADDAKFDSREKLSADPEVKKAFLKQLDLAEELSNKIRARSPSDRNALLASVLANGLRGDYAAMIEKKNMTGLKYMKTSRATAEMLLDASPDCYDAYLAVGVENYLLSLEPVIFRWFLRLGGAQTDREEGLRKLRLTADKGYYLAPYARLLLAVAAMRDDDDEQARALLSQLSSQFPDNALLKQELKRVSE